MLQKEGYEHYRLAVFFSFFLAALLAVFVLIYGKTESFLIINKFNSHRFDYFFTWVTYLGDGIIWVPLFIYILAWKREFLITAIAAVIICTVLTHFLKRVVFPEDLRPAAVLRDQVHLIEGVRINHSNSFPSGHTSTAFTLALLLAFGVKRWYWSIFFPFIAFLVGYSRVYLAQHFVTDVCAGMVVGIISSYCSLMIFERYGRKRDLTGDTAANDDKEVSSRNADYYGD
jgi:membrane-associated phospholipid phosphatase